jgi:hypothetical protein
LVEMSRPIKPVKTTKCSSLIQEKSARRKWDDFLLRYISVSKLYSKYWHKPLLCQMTTRYRLACKTKKGVKSLRTCRHCDGGVSQHSHCIEMVSRYIIGCTWEDFFATVPCRNRAVLHGYTERVRLVPETI